MSFDPTTAKPAEEFDEATAKPAETGYFESLKNAGISGLRFGPVGFGSALMKEGMEQGAKLIDRAAYGAGGFVTDQAAKVLPPEAAAAAGYATNVATQAVPAFLGGEAAKVAAPVLKATGERLMHSALKPPLESLRDGSATKAINTLLEEGINVSKGGVASLRSMIDDLNGQITRAIADSPATVNKGQVASELTNTLKRFERQVTPGADRKAIEAAWEEFLNHPLLTGEKIPVQLAQDMKQGTYRILREKYGEQGSAATEAQKTLARGLKEGIADAVPGVAQMNARESQLINALNLTERRALLAMNNNPAGLTLLAENKAAAAAFLADRSTLFKSLAARMIYSGRERIPQAVGSGAGVAYQVGTQNRPDQ